MYKDARQRMLSGDTPFKRFWRALLRFGSPRFTVETFSEFTQMQAVNDDECSEELVDCSCQLNAA